ncbi:MAG: hypothetical protein ABIS45_15335 [Burkholderiales bacterium]
MPHTLWMSGCFPLTIKIVRAPVVIVMTLLLAACVAPMVVAGIAVPTYVSTPAFETASQYSDSSGRAALKTTAEAGDRVAQYNLGESYCCNGGGPLDRVSVYDNKEATAWYCKSANQDYGPAQMRLAKLYSGHPIHGISMVQRASALVGTTEADMAVALLWANVAAAQRVDGSVELRDGIRAHATAEQRVRADALLADWHAAPCLWADVFPSKK